MNIQWLLVDGYSLIHEDPRIARHVPAQLDLARQMLIRDLEKYGPELAPRITVVFDGRGTKPGTDSPSDMVDVLFSPAHLTADSMIERLVQKHAHPSCLLVITSDHAERDTVEASGAQSMSCSQYLDGKKKRNEMHSYRTHTRGDKHTGPILGDSFPTRHET